ncbi:hypothetical protein D9M71_794070 [compost metagenome]
MLEPVVIANLDLLFVMHDLTLDLNGALLDDFSAAVRESVVAGDPVAYVAIEYGARWGFRDQFIAKIYQDIWDRKLLIDFTEPILIDHPFSVSGGDLLTVHGSLFEESDQ